MQKKIVFIVCVVLAAAACRKGSFAPESYYGKVTINSSVLSVVDMDFYMDGNKMGRIKPGKSLTTGFLSAGKAGRLMLYKADSALTSNNLILDTVFTIPKNNTVSMDVIYSELLGIKGTWDKNMLSVHADSVRLQVKYVSTVTKIAAPLPAYNLRLYTGSALKDSMDVGPVGRNKFGQSFTISFKDPKTAKGRDLYYRLIDPATGQYLKDYRYDNFRLYSFVSGTPYAGGVYGLITITISDDAAHAGSYKVSYPNTFQKVN